MNKHLFRTSLAIAALALLGGAAHATDVALGTFESLPEGPNGGSNTWVMGTPSTTNPRVTTADHYEGAQAWAVDFSTGPETTGDNLSMANMDLDTVAIPASGSNAISVAVKAPAGTVFDCTVVLSDGKTWASPKQIQRLGGQWQVHTIPLSKMRVEAGSAGTDLAALNSAGLTTDWAGLIVYGGGNTLGTPSLSGTIYVDSIQLVQNDDVDLMDFDSFSAQAWGQMNAWTPYGTVTVSNMRIQAAERAQGVLALGLDFVTGSTIDDLSQSAVWAPQITVPAGGVTALQYLVKAPVGTTVRPVLTFDSGKPARELPRYTLTTDNQWEQVTVALADLNPPLTPSDLTTYNTQGVKTDGSFSLQVFGPPHGLANASGALYFDDFKFSSAPVPVELSSFSAE